MSVNPVLATEARDLDPRELFESRIEFLRSNRSFFLCLVFVAQQQHTCKRWPSRWFSFPCFIEENVIIELTKASLECRVDLNAGHVTKITKANDSLCLTRLVDESLFQIWLDLLQSLLQMIGFSRHRDKVDPRPIRLVLCSWGPLDLDRTVLYCCSLITKAVSLSLKYAKIVAEGGLCNQQHDYWIIMI